MKLKIILYASVLCFITVFSSCSNDCNEIVYEVSTEKESPIYSAFGKAEAIAIAQSFLSSNCSTRAASGFEVGNCEIYQNRASRNPNTDSDTQIYIINFHNPNSYVLVSSKHLDNPVIGYSLEGNTTLVNIENSPLKEYLDFAIQTDYSSDSSYTAYEPNPGDLVIPTQEYYAGILCNKYVYDTQLINRGPKLSTLWDQVSPYNYYYDTYSWNSLNANTAYGGRFAAGCVPIAVSQVLKYHNYPTSYAGHNYVWSNMPNSLTSGSSTSEITMTARLIRDMFNLTNAQYYYDGSTGAQVSGVVNAFYTLGYGYDLSTTTGSFNFSSDSIRSSIDSNCPILTLGLESNEITGHAWVIDGYKKIRRRTVYVRASAPNDTIKDVTTIITYYHNNWGWGNTVPPTYTLNSFQVGGYSFDYNLIFFLNTKPNN